ncbi:MAG: PKD domain-containing protein [Ruminococcaceae bacterium]|nr:PKD domain-containing protein [Oscillospiraceae bacterium]
MKKILSFICILSILSAISLSGISAVRAPIASGDVDLAEDRNIKDATLIQKYLAGIVEFTALQELLADTDGDGKVTIKDATLIQKDIADIARIETDGLFPYMGAHYFYPDYSSGKAMSGVPVTFYVSAFAYDERSNPITYEFYVNDELVQERSDKSSFTYTFEEAGSYHISAKLYSRFDFTERLFGYYDYVVVEPYESEEPVIKSIYCTRQTHSDFLFEVYEKEELTFVAEAIYGSGEYEYAFILDGKTIQDFSEKNTCTYMFKEPEYNSFDDPYVNQYTLQVIARNKGTDTSTTEEYHLTISIPLPA